MRMMRDPGARGRVFGRMEMTQTTCSAAKRLVKAKLKRRKGECALLDAPSLDTMSSPPTIPQLGYCHPFCIQEGAVAVCHTLGEYSA